VLAAIDPVLGIAAMLTVLAAAGFARSATFGLCAFVFVTFLEVVTNYTGSAALSPIKVFGGALVVVALLDLLIRTRHASLVTIRPAAPAWARHPVVLACVVGFVVLGIISASWAVNVDQVRSLSVRLVTELLIFLAIGVLLVRPGQLRAVSTTVLAGGVLATVFGLLTGAELAGRQIGTFSDPNEYASAMVASMALGFGALGTIRSRAGRFSCAVGIAICGYGVLASESRGGLVASVVVAIVVVVSSRGRERVRMMGASAVFVAGLLVLLVLTPTGQQSLARITDGDSSGRSDLWRIARAEFRDAPAHGVGLGNYPAVANRYITRDIEHPELVNNDAPRTTHNSYLEIAAELGIAGLVTFGGFVLGCLLLAWRALRASRSLVDTQLSALGRGVLAGTVGVLASCIFLSGQYAELLWALLACCVAYDAMVRRALDEPT
jgi:O-antigen ligase